MALALSLSLHVIVIGISIVTIIVCNCHCQCNYLLIFIVNVIVIVILNVFFIVNPCLQPAQMACPSTHCQILIGGFISFTVLMQVFLKLPWKFFFFRCASISCFQVEMSDSVSEWVSHTFSDLQSIQYLHSLQPLKSLQD